MKKALSLILALVCMFALAIPAFALDQNTQTGTTTVDYTIASTYTVSIPANFTFTTANTDVEKEVSADDVYIANGTKLLVSVTSANAYKMVYEGSQIAYTAKIGSTTLSAQNTTALEVAAGTQDGSATIVFNSALTGYTKAGLHVDTLTFTITNPQVGQ